MVHRLAVARPRDGYRDRRTQRRRRRRGQAGPSAFQRGDPLLERRHGRVGQARVDVAEGLQVEQARGVIGAVEDEARRLVDRQGPGARRRVRNLPGVDRQGLGLKAAVGHGRSRLVPATGRDHAGVDAGPVQPTEQARMLDLDAAVHHHVEPGFGGEPCRFHVLHPDLLPEASGADGDRLPGDRQDVFGATEHVDDVDRHLDRLQARMATLAQDLRVPGVHRHDAVAVLLHVLGGEETGAVPLGGQADHGDGAGGAQDAAEGRNVVGHGR